jgi:hypothetical protein
LREVLKEKSGLTPMRLQRRGATMLEAARAYGLPHHATRPDHSLQRAFMGPNGLMP